MEIYKPKNFSGLINVPVRTLSAWHKSGKLVPFFDDDGKTFYSEDHLAYCRENGLDLSGTCIRAFYTEVDLNSEQCTKFRQNLGVMRFVYNLFIDTNIENNDNKRPYQNGFVFSKWLNNEYLPIHPEKSWIKDASSKAVKQIIMNADQAYKKYMSNIKEFAEKLARGAKVKRDKEGKPKWPNPPKFKKKFVNEPSYYFIGDGVRIERHRIKIPVLGWVHLKEKAYLPVGGEVISGTLRICDNRVFVSVRARIAKNNKLNLSTETGLIIECIIYT